ncbi:MAG: hypothetical protein K2N01_13260 [Lachnospiraceae bacterium]|nr:hypothetical protein [Lachnospiraceae bacterium]
MTLSTIETYSEFKTALGTELKNQAEGFVRTGYLLKVARDTDILKDSGYTTVAEFAQAEYGLTKDVVSRYIAINDRYSRDGYSEYLQEQYEGYGVAKLQEMLTLPDAVLGLMSPDLTKREIQDIKREIKEEEQTTDLEVMMEGEAPDQEHMTLLQKAIRRYFHEEREQFIQLADVITGKAADPIEQTMDILAPSGVALKTVRVQGIGRLMLSIQGRDNDIEMLQVRTGEKEQISWQKFIYDLKMTFSGCTGRETWERIYGEPFKTPEPPKEEKKAEVAPVQPKPTQKNASKQTKSESKKPEDTSKEPAKVTEQPESEPITQEREPIVSEEQQAVAEQIPGQTSIEKDFKEYMSEVVTGEIVENTESEEDEPAAGDNVIRGYKAAITADLRKLQSIWDSKDPNKVTAMLEITKNLEWRLERIKEAENEDGAEVSRSQE